VVAARSLAHVLCSFVSGSILAQRSSRSTLGRVQICAAGSYHSAHGHTEHIAHRVAEGVRSAATAEVDLIKADSLVRNVERLLPYDGLILGSPTYLGGVSASFKAFMDAAGSMWRTQHLQGKLAAGFTVSSLPASDKQSTLLSMFVFGMQHGMVWVGNPVLPEQHTGVAYDEAAQPPRFLVGPDGAGRARLTGRCLRARRPEDRAPFRVALRRDPGTSHRASLKCIALPEFIMLPKKFAPMLFGLLLSGMMSLLVSGLAIWRATGLVHGFVASWAGAWLLAWPIAFPAVLLAAPLARRVVNRLVGQS
jgi:multimeric flavodoxin WrbA